MENYIHIKHAPLIELNHRCEEISIPTVPENIHVFLDIFKKGDLSFAKQHWHSSMQFNVVLEGTLHVYINNSHVVLNQGEGIFVNSNTIHCLNQHGQTDCISYSFQIPPSSICSEKEIVLFNKYITPIVSNPQFSHILLDHSEPWRAEILKLLGQAFNAINNQEFAYELKIKSLICNIWILILSNMNLLKQGPTDAFMLSNVPRIKVMLSYISEHYQEKITLNQIADAAHISISECSRCFKTFLNQTPIEYVTQVRVISACKLFSTTNMKISEVAEATGFSDSAYFYRVFNKIMGCTPKKYQQSCRERLNS